MFNTVFSCHRVIDRVRCLRMRSFSSRANQLGRRQALDNGFLIALQIRCSSFIPPSTAGEPSGAAPAGAACAAPSALTGGRVTGYLTAHSFCVI